MSRFQSVDQDNRAFDLIQYLDGLAVLPEIEEMRSAAFAIVADASPRTVLDLGCGTGDTTRRLAQLCDGSVVVGIDASEILVAAARERHPDVTFAQGDACALDVAPATFEVCYAERLLMHLASPKICLGEVARALKPGGIFISIEPKWLDSRLEAVGDLEATAFLADYNLAIAQPAAPEEVMTACTAMGWRSVWSSHHLLSTETFPQADSVIRFSNALSRQGVRGGALELALRRWEECFDLFQLPFAVQAWRA